MHNVIHREEWRVGLGGNIDLPLAAVRALELKTVAGAVDRVALANRRPCSDDCKPDYPDARSDGPCTARRSV